MPQDELYDPVERFLTIIKGKRKAAIIIYINDGIKRYNELRKELSDVSERILIKQLKDLEREGIIEKKTYPEVPPRVEYRLTEKGSTLCPIIKKMWKWGVDN